MKTTIKIEINCNKNTCGKCSRKSQHSNAYPELYTCEIFDKQLEIKSGKWQTGLSFYRLEKCKQATIKVINNGITTQT